MKTFTITLLLIAAALLSCQDDSSSPACATENPTEELPWLKELLTEVEATDFGQYVYVVQAVYISQPVFIIQNCCPFCLSTYPVYNCQGDIICYYGDCATDTFIASKVIWASAQSSCQF